MTTQLKNNHFFYLTVQNSYSVCMMKISVFYFLEIKIVCIHKQIPSLIKKTGVRRNSPWDRVLRIPRSWVPKTGKQARKMNRRMNNFIEAHTVMSVLHELQHLSENTWKIPLVFSLSFFFAAGSSLPVFATAWAVSAKATTLCEPLSCSLFYNLAHSVLSWDSPACTHTLHIIM
jgi:hypothetical protein